MRVLAFCDYYHPDSIGGAERVAREIYQRLVTDHGVEMIVVGAVPRQAATQDLGDTDGDGDVRLVSVPGWDVSRFLGAQLMLAPSLTRSAREVIAQFEPDLIHVNGLHFHSSLAGVRLARRHSLPLAVTAHLADVAAMPGGFRSASIGFDKWLGGRVVRSADRVLAVSTAVGAHVRVLGARSECVVIAPNGVDHRRFRARTRGPRDESLRVILVGRLIANKGPMHALDAVAQARSQGRDVRLTIVGGGPMTTQVARRSAEPDLAGAVHLAGRVPDVEQWLRHADVALRPSYTEGLPLAVLEALASGVPVVCTDVPGSTEIVQDGHNGLVVPIGDVEAMGRALVRLHDDRAELARLSAAGVDTAAGFTWEASAKAHLEAFRLVTAQTGPARVPA